MSDTTAGTVAETIDAIEEEVEVAARVVGRSQLFIAVLSLSLSLLCVAFWLCLLIRSH